MKKQEWIDKIKSHIDDDIDGGADYSGDLLHVMVLVAMIAVEVIQIDGLKSAGFVNDDDNEILVGLQANDRRVDFHLKEGEPVVAHVVNENNKVAIYNLPLWMCAWHVRWIRMGPACVK